MKNTSFSNLNCSCGNTVRVDSNTTAVICHMCVTRMVGIHVKPNPKDDESRIVWRRQVAEKKEAAAARRELYKGFPRGWHLKSEYKAEDGRVFQRGKEVK